MRPFLRLISVICLAIFTAVSASAQAPANDLFVNAITLIGPTVTATGSNVGATKQFGQEPFLVGGDFGGASVWWNWTAAASGQTTIDTEGSSFDTQLGVFTGAAQNQLTLVADNGNYNGNTWSRVDFNAVAGTTYRIYVDGLRVGGGPGGRATQGNIVLHVKGVGGITFLTPTNGTVFTVGDPIPVAVTIDADFPNPPATRVDFYVGGNLFASKSAAPYSAVATNIPAGSNSVYVIAYDNAEAPVQSPVQRIFVQSIGVTLLTPFEDTVYLNTNPITVTAWSYLPAGSITNIEFFVDGVKFGEDDAPPYSGVWSNVTGGSHRFTAVGRADSGAVYISQPVNIGVASVLLPNASVWKYLDDGSDQGTAWFASDFNDSAWASGPAPLGYSDSNGRLPATTNSFGPSATAKYITTYYRQAFMASNAASFAQIRLNIERDDGAVVYLNGTELSRFNMPTGAVTSVTGAASNAGDDGGTIFSITVNPARLLDGVNVFAVEIHQDLGTSSDIWFQMNLQGIPVIIHNLSPTVTLTSPTNGFFALAPPSIAMTAAAADADGSVAKVEYYANGVKVAESTNTDYSAEWVNPPVGPHALTAVAVDDQGGRTESDATMVIVYDAVGTPYVQIIDPVDGFAVEGGTNQVLTAFASAQYGVTNVQFLSDGVVVGEDSMSPFSIVWNAPFGTNTLTAVVFDSNGLSVTSPVVRLVAYPNAIAPVIVTNFPAPFATVTSLTSIKVIFSEPVQNVDAADLLLNTYPATGVTGSGSNYVFTFPQPPYGEVEVLWRSSHGITDFGFPSNLPFDELGQTAQWEYFLIDRTPPTISSRTPAAGATVTNLDHISVTFSESVTNVDASDLLVNGTPATGLAGSGLNYTFSVIQPPVGTVNITWATNHSIFDEAETPNAFNRASGAWSFTLDNRVVLVQSNSMWNFVKGFAEASDPIDAWRQPDFDDLSWSNAPAPFFFGDPYTNASIRGTLLSDMQSNYTTIFLRKEFEVTSRGSILNLLLNHQSDDGFIAWLNGVEVLRYNVPAGTLPYNTNASVAANEPSQTGAAYIVATLTNAAVSRLDNGRNVLAIQAFNQNLTNSSDFGFNAQLYYFPIDATVVPPRVVSSEPATGDIFYLTNATINFSEGVSGVDAGDLLINGVPAASVSSTTNDIYTFEFPQPPYGPVVLTWATNHGIADFDSPPKPFDGTAASSIISYFLINPSNPKVATQAPLGGSTLTGLTAVVVTFTEAVSGVDATDFLVNGAPASTVSSADNITYNLTFPQPAFGTVAIRWKTNHGIVDVEAGNAFDPTRFGGQWTYTLIDPVPSVTLTSPTNNTFFLPPARITLRATASDNDGTVALVEFYESATRLGEGTNAPYSLALSNLDLGIYTFRAVATDNIGLSRTSTPVVINVVTSLPITLVRGPYLQSGSPTGGVVRWRTQVRSDALVFYGTDVNNLTNVAQETTVTNEHIVKISGLEPDTKYYYSIGSAAFRLVGGTNDGANYWFQSSPPAGTRRPIRFWALGDAGTAGNGSPDRQRSTRDAFYNYAATNGATDLMLMLGDNAYNSGTDSEHQAAVFDMYPTTLRNKFLWPTLGNHETSQSTTATDFPYLNIFSLPINGEAGGVPSGNEKYYSFDYGNIHFVCLDSMTSGRTGTSPMARWLVNDLDETAQEWVVVFYHHSLYTKGTHDSDAEGDLVELRENLIPIFEAHGVDLVLMGHSHVYERSYLLDRHYGLSSTFNATNKIDGGSGREEDTGAYHKNDEGRGVIYTIAGSAGQALGGPLNHPAHFISINELGTVVVDVTGNRLDAKFLNSAGVIRDTYTLLKPSPFPAAPQNLTALPASVTEINLAWTDAADNELGYSVERSTDGINFTEVLTAAAGAIAALDTGLSANTTYFYRVRGTNTIGPGEYSQVASANTVMPNSPPRAPVGLVASADNGLQFFRSQMVLRWQDRSTNEAAFQIERSGDGASFTPIATVAANLTSFVDRHLDSATFYYYRVRAVNALGQSAPTVIAGDETHPQTQLARTGENVAFHAGAEGAPPVTYQWRFLGTPLSGETNETLLVENVLPGDEGDYTVAIRDADGRFNSNPAFLFVLSPPSIVSQPSDLIAIAGTSVSLQASADGTAPLTYQWRKNGTLLPGATSPTLSFPSVQVSDTAGYYLVVENDFGAATSRVARLDVFATPTLAPIPDAFAEVLNPLVLSNVVTDPNVPPLKLTYSLAPGAPTNATLNATNGLFRWTPNRSQAPSTNAITVRITDATHPLLSNSTTFTVSVNDYLELTAGSVNLQTGETNSVPIDIFSSAALLNLQCVLRFPQDRLADAWLEPLQPEIASATMQAAGANAATLTFTVMPGQTLQGTQRVARLYFTATAGQDSSFVPLDLDSMNAAVRAAGVEPTLLLNDGRAVVVGARPLLEARTKPGNQREITLYGRRGTTYVLEYTTSLANGVAWRPRGTIPGSSMTNLTQSLLLGLPAPPVYYRARQQ